MEKTVILRNAARLIRTAVVLLLVVLLSLSLALNAAMFLGGKLYLAASGTFDAMTGKPSVATRHVGEIARLKSDRDRERRLRRKLQSQVAELNSDLARERKVATGLRRDLDKAAATQVRQTQAVSRTKESVARRAVASATRNVTSMAGEALPWVGTAVIVGGTALEVRDLCEMLRDLNELDQVFDLDEEDDAGERTVCSMRIPDREEVFSTVQTAPEVAWSSAKAATASIGQVREYTLPEIDWPEYRTALSEAAAVTRAKVNGGLAATTEGAISVWSWLTGTDEAGAGEPLPRED